MTFNVHLAKFDVTPRRHKQSHKRQQEVLPIVKIRPQRIAARCAREMMTMMLYGSMKMMFTQ